jgi:glycerol kinase
VLGIEVERPAFVETTAMGAAMLAGVGAGLFSSLEHAAALRGETQLFRPAIPEDQRRARLEGWARAVRSVLQAGDR